MGTPVSISSHSRLTWLLEIPVMPIIRQEVDDPICKADAARRPRRGLDELVDRAGRDALDVGLPAEVS
jgi:hypothetical protein